MDNNLLKDMLDKAIEAKSAVTIHGNVVSPTTVQVLNTDGTSILIKLPYKDDTFVEGVAKLDDIMAVIVLPITFDAHYQAVIDEKKKEEEAMKARVEEGKKAAEAAMPPENDCSLQEKAPAVEKI